MSEQEIGTQEGQSGLTARLTVHVGEKRDANTAHLPVEVRTPLLFSVARGLTDEPMAVPAGVYVVSARLPGGGPLLAKVEVIPGEDRTIVLALPATVSPAPPETRVEDTVESVRAEREVVSALRGRNLPEFAQRPVTFDISLAEPLHTLTRRKKKQRAHTLSFHLLSGNPLDGALRGGGCPSARLRFGEADEELKVQFAKGGERAFRILSTGADGFVLKVTDPGLPVHAFALLRITERGSHSRFVAVPVAWRQPVNIQVNRIRMADESVLQVIVHPDDPISDALLHYRRAGQLAEARQLLERYRDEAFGPADSLPLLRRAVIVLLTLRLSTPMDWKSGSFYDRLLEAATSYEFPDLHAAAAAAAARAGDMALSRAHAWHAIKGGLPYLSDGLALLHAQVLEGARPPRPDAEMKALYQRLLPFLDLVDLKPVLLTLRGGDRQLYRR